MEPEERASSEKSYPSVRWYFRNITLIIAFIFLILGFILLTKGADYFIENSQAFAEDKGISPHVVGVTIVAFGTSLPELLVSGISSVQGYNDLALGNIVGSNISNIGLVLASSIFVFYYVLGSEIEPNADSNKDSYIMLAAVVLLLIFAQDNTISFLEGCIFFILLHSGCRYNKQDLFIVKTFFSCSNAH